MATVNQRFALSNPALVSAPLKKSFSRLSWPIFACRVFTSTGGSLDTGPAAPNTSAARSCNCRFHSVILFGCTSNCCASSASVRSPLTAAWATFALNAAECVRRVRFVISSVPLPALSLAQAPAVPLIPLSDFCAATSKSRPTAYASLPFHAPIHTHWPIDVNLYVLIWRNQAGLDFAFQRAQTSPQRCVINVNATSGAT